jgi:hypothetical protein
MATANLELRRIRAFYIEPTNRLPLNNSIGIHRHDAAIVQLTGISQRHNSRYPVDHYHANSPKK